MPERLELFIQVCEGIQHAHQKAIIHRDVKPSNILVTEQDGRPAPKIIDLGVAKATAQRLTERTLFTELGQLIGTPEYMSPEQAESLYRECLAARSRVNGPEHPETLNVKHNLAMFLTIRGDSAEAVKLHREVLDTKIRIMGPQHPQVLSSMNGLGLALSAEEDYEDAIAVFQQLDLLADKIYPDTHRTRHIYRRHYGTCLLKAGRTSEAEEMLIRAYLGLSETLGSSHVNTLEVAQHLVDLYESQGNPQMAAKYRVED